MVNNGLLSLLGAVLDASRSRERLACGCGTLFKVLTSAVEEGHFLNSALDMSPIEPDDSEYRRLMGNAPAFGDSRSTPLHVRFGPYEVNLHKRELRKGTLRLKVPHQSFQIL